MQNMCNISSIRAKVKFEQRKSERETGTRKEKLMNDIQKKKNDMRIKEERKSRKIMEPDGPISLRVHETYLNNIVSLRGITYCTAPYSDF